MYRFFEDCIDWYFLFFLLCVFCVCVCVCVIREREREGRERERSIDQTAETSKQNSITEREREKG